MFCFLMACLGTILTFLLLLLPSSLCLRPDVVVVGTTVGPNFVRREGKSK